MGRNYVTRNSETGLYEIDVTASGEYGQAMADWAKHCLLSVSEGLCPMCIKGLSRDTGTCPSGHGNWAIEDGDVVRYYNFR